MRIAIRAAMLGIIGLATAISNAAEPAAIAKHTDWVTTVEFSTADGTLASGGGQTLLYRPGEIKLWNPADGALKASLDGSPTCVWSVAFSPDGKTLASGGYDGIVKLWDVPSGKPKGELKKHSHWVRALAFTAKGDQLISGGEDGQVIVWDVGGAKDLRLDRRSYWTD